jgi:hypothetical protein
LGLGCRCRNGVYRFPETQDVHPDDLILEAACEPYNATGSFAADLPREAIMLEFDCLGKCPSTSICATAASAL